MESTPVVAGVCAALVNTSQTTRHGTMAAANCDRSLGRRRTMCTISNSRILNPMQNFLRRVDRFQNIEVLDCNHFFAQQSVANPIEQTLPVFLTNQNHREWFDLARLD